MENNPGDNAIERSRRVIEAVLADISATYTQVGGGGISEIKQTATNTFEVSISQEERVDIIAYEIAIATDGSVSLVNRKTVTKSY